MSWISYKSTAIRGDYPRIYRRQKADTRHHEECVVLSRVRAAAFDTRSRIIGIGEEFLWPTRGTPHAATITERLF
jgi:hypothetical protein